MTCILFYFDADFKNITVKFRFIEKASHVVLNFFLLFNYTRIQEISLFDTSKVNLSNFF
jgi:hypothetical protein